MYLIAPAGDLDFSAIAMVCTCVVVETPEYATAVGNLFVGMDLFLL